MYFSFSQRVGSQTIPEMDRKIYSGTFDKHYYVSSRCFLFSYYDGVSVLSKQDNGNKHVNEGFYGQAWSLKYAVGFYFIKPFFNKTKQKKLLGISRHNSYYFAFCCFMWQLEKKCFESSLTLRVFLISSCMHIILH